MSYAPNAIATLILWLGTPCFIGSLMAGPMAHAGQDELDKEEIIKVLGLEKHVEGGYFRRTFQADHRPMLDLDIGPRFTMTSIYYMLDSASPVGHWHLNKSDIIHYFHSGSPITYYMIDEKGELSTAVLGPDLAKGQRFQLTVKGGTWKASRLDPEGEYGLISEAVAPGFEYKDMTLGKRSELLNRFPQHEDLIIKFTRPD